VSAAGGGRGGRGERGQTLLARLCAMYPEPGREHWYAAVMCGEVRVDGERVREPGRTVSAACTIAVQHEPALASRAGYKLLHALERFAVPVAGKVMLDAGAATGGFTDCLLRRGAGHVHCVDVAYGALAYRLRNDPRTTVHERTNIMHLRPGALHPRPDGAVCDLSFRSLRGAAARILELTRDGWLLALVKPQFEWHAVGGGAPGEGDAAGATAPRFDGLVRGTDAIVAVVRTLQAGLAAEGIAMRRCTPAPVTGRRGNREVLALLTVGRSASAQADATIETLREELARSEAGAVHPAC
jgi:23S rRNA (cytidine1920-2'-O)/16S rRNA (cytidine1409-2'-O)-methyltransferase